MFSAYLSVFWKLFLLRVGPQDIPFSRALFCVTLALLISIGFIVNSFHYSKEENLVISLIDTAFLNTFIYLVLKFKNLQNRFFQVATATFGVFAIFYIALLVVLIVLHSEVFVAESPIFTLLFMFQLGLVVYSIIVFGHILQNAISANKLVGVTLSLTYYIVSLFFMQKLLSMFT